VLAATDFVLPGIEIIDSRYRDFKFDLKSVIADNTSAARFVVGGAAARSRELDLRTLGVVLEKNGQPVAMAPAPPCWATRLAAVAMLANHLGARGQEIPAGTLHHDRRRHRGHRGAMPATTSTCASRTWAASRCAASTRSCA
jgi:2-oxo-3-hexenedioate decarboxylase